MSGRTRQSVDCVDLRHRNCRTRGGKSDKHDVEYKLRCTRWGDTRPDTYLLHIQTRIIISSLVHVPGQVRVPPAKCVFNHSVCVRRYVIQHLPRTHHVRILTAAFVSRSRAATTGHICIAPRLPPTSSSRVGFPRRFPASASGAYPRRPVASRVVLPRSPPASASRVGLQGRTVCRLSLSPHRSLYVLQ